MLRIGSDVTVCREAACQPPPRHHFLLELAPTTLHFSWIRICAGSVVYGWHGPPTISNEAAPCLLSNDVSVKPFVLSPWIKRSIYKPCLKDKSDWIDQQHDGHYWRTWRWSVSDDRDQVVRNPDIVLLKGLIYRIAYVHSFKIQSVNVSRGEWWDLRSRRFGALHATCSTGNSISPVSHPL